MSSAAVRQQSFRQSSFGSFGKTLPEDKLLKKVTEWPLACLMRKSTVVYPRPFLIVTLFLYIYIYVVIGGILIGQFSFWNYGLIGGFGNYLLAMLVSGAMYFCLANSLAELSSVLPFAGMLLIYGYGEEY